MSVLRFSHNKNIWPLYESSDWSLCYNKTLYASEYVIDNRSHSDWGIITKKINTREGQRKYCITTNISSISAPDISWYGLAWNVNNDNYASILRLDTNKNGFALSTPSSRGLVDKILWTKLQYPLNKEERINLVVEFDRFLGEANIGINRNHIYVRNLELFDYCKELGFVVGPLSKMTISYLQLDAYTNPNHFRKFSGKTVEFNANDSVPDNDGILAPQYFLSNGKITENREEWWEDYNGGGYLDDEDYYIYGRDNNDF